MEMNEMDVHNKLCLEHHFDTFHLFLFGMDEVVLTISNEWNGMKMDEMV